MSIAPATAYAVSLVVAISSHGIHTGTAFAVSSDVHTTRLVTAAHVLIDATRVVIIFQDGSGHEAKILARDRVRDAAVVSIDVGHLPTVTIRRRPPAVEDAMVVIGYPGTREFAIRGSEVALIGSALPITVTGTVQAMQQRGESIIFKADVGHGDSGAPIVDTATNTVIGVTTGTFRSAGILLEYNGLDIGLSGAGLDAVLHPALPPGGAQPPQYVVALSPATPASAKSPLASIVHSAFVTDFGEQADFVAVDAAPANDAPATCRSSNAHAVADVSASSDGALVAVGLTVSDCIGEPFYVESQSLLADEVSDESIRSQAILIVGQLESDFNGWVDSRRPAWTSLLHYGIAVAPDDPHYYVLARLGVGELDANHVLAVMPRGPAFEAGLRKGDVIAAIGGRNAKDMSPAEIAVALDRPSVAVTVGRGSAARALTLHPHRFAGLVRMLGFAP